MANMPLPEAHELHEITVALEIYLAKLDELGAGIAAIHVNAAIEQLRTNLEYVVKKGAGSFDPDLICLLPII
jgi:hypothetical protein